VIGRSDFGRPRLVVLGIPALLIVAAAMVFGWRAGAADEAVTAPVDATAWDLPRPKVSDTAREVAILRQRRPWGGQASFSDSETPNTGPVSTAAWRLVGTVERGTQWFALISVGEQRAEHLEYRAVGDPLPNGGNVVKVDADSVTVGGWSAGSEDVTYRLFGKKQ
jgi:hypothetical protein